MEWGMRNFLLYRKEDETGISGTGLIAEGVEFFNGQCVLRWLTKPGSIGIFNSLEDLLRIHGHQGKTRAVWHSNEHLLFNEKDFK
jgi:hypothetical protein